MQDVQSDPQLLIDLRAAALHQMTAEQIRTQKIDYILNSLGDANSVTKAAVEKELDRLAGNAR